MLYTNNISTEVTEAGIPTKECCTQVSIQIDWYLSLVHTCVVDWIRPPLKNGFAGLHGS